MRGKEMICFATAVRLIECVCQFDWLEMADSALDNGGRTLKNPGMARVVIENLTKVFKGPRGESIRAVSNASLTVSDGEFVALVGPSGCGKSTTLRMIAGLEEVTSGTIAIDGEVINAVAPKDRDIAMVFQNHALYPHMTAYENMAFGLKLRHYSRAEIEARVGEAAEILGLKDCLHRKPAELSGGQRQRVAVGRAMVRQPKVFLFDEPLSNLDAPMRAQMRREISRLHARLGATMIYVTHDQVEAMTLGDRIAVMKDGVIQQVAEPMGLYRQPANKFVAGFIGSPPMNFFRGMLVRQEGGIFFQEEAKSGAGFVVRVEDEMASRLTGHGNKRIVLGIRPENIAEKFQARDARPEWTVAVVIEAMELLGAEAHLYAGTGAHAFVARIQNGQRMEPGHKILLVLDMCEAHFFDAETERVIVG